MLGLILALIIVGVVLYLVNTMIPMDPKIKTILNVVVVIIVVIWVIQSLGLVGPLHDVRVR